MEITETLLQYETDAENGGDISVIVVAAGASSRMGGVSKQLAVLGGIPVLARTLLTLNRSKCVNSIVVVSRECDVLLFQMLVQKYMISKVTDIVIGGSNRCESVRNGIMRLSNDTEYVLIHDGARPLVSDAVITRVADATRKYGAAACAVAVKDTLKLVENGIIKSTLDRSNVFSVQTPQGFAYTDYKKVIEETEDLSKYTDDCALMESAGTRIHIVEGDYNNIKITTPEDLTVAESIISAGGTKL